MRLYIVVLDKIVTTDWANVRAFTSIKEAKEYGEQIHDHWLALVRIFALRKGGKFCELLEFGGYDWSKPSKKTVPCSGILEGTVTPLKFTGSLPPTPGIACQGVISPRPRIAAPMAALIKGK